MDASSNQNAALLIGNSAATLAGLTEAARQSAPAAEQAPAGSQRDEDFSIKMRELQASEPPDSRPPSTTESQPAESSATATDSQAQPESAPDQPTPTTPVADSDEAATDAVEAANGGEILPVPGQTLPEVLPDTTAPATAELPMAGTDPAPEAAAEPAAAAANAAAVTTEPPAALPDTDLAQSNAAPLIPAQGSALGDGSQPPAAAPAPATTAGTTEIPRPLPTAGSTPAASRTDAAQTAPATTLDTSLAAMPFGDSSTAGHGHAGDSPGRQSDPATAAALREILLPAQPAARGPAFADASALAGGLAASGATGTPPPTLGELLGQQAGQGLTQQSLQPFAGREQFTQGLGERLTLMAGNGLQAARIQLHPERLGALDVRIELDDHQARVWFHTPHAATRDVLEQALPRLRELFAGQGLELLDAGVSGGQEQDAASHETQRPGDWLAARRLSDDFDETAFATRVERRLSGRRLLDVRA